jgi:hypothetical protein
VIIMKRRRLIPIGAALLLPLSVLAAAQSPKPAPGAAVPTTARAAAAFDMTGYWVSEVTEKWRFRMIVPDKGDYTQVPLNPAGRKVANAWDPARDEATGEACRSYGAAGLLQVPGRLHVTWQDDNTIRLDTDSGTQKRLFRFAPPQGQAATSESRGGAAPPANGSPTWQGYSVATWGGAEPRDRRDGQGGPAVDDEGNLAQGPRREPDYLKVTTTRMRTGYLQKNGVPYSANAVLEEYFDLASDPYTKNTWLLVTTVITDPQYLNEPLIMHSHFKKLPDASGWDPTSCRANEPR